MDVAGPSVTHAGAESRNPNGRSARTPQRSARHFVCSYAFTNSGRLNLHAFGNEAGRVPATHVVLTSRSWRGRGHWLASRRTCRVPCMFACVQIGRRRGEARVRGGVNDDIDLAVHPVRHIGIEPKTRRGEYPRRWESGDLPEGGRHRSVPVGERVATCLAGSRRDRAAAAGLNRSEHSVERSVLQQLCRRCGPIAPVAPVSRID